MSGGTERTVDKPVDASLFECSFPRGRFIYCRCLNLIAIEEARWNLWFLNLESSDLDLLYPVLFAHCFFRILFIIVVRLWRLMMLGPESWVKLTTWRAILNGKKFCCKYNEELRCTWVYLRTLHSGGCGSSNTYQALEICSRSLRSTK